LIGYPWSIALGSALVGVAIGWYVTHWSQRLRTLAEPDIESLKLSLACRSSQLLSLEHAATESAEREEALLQRLQELEQVAARERVSSARLQAWEQRYRTDMAAANAELSVARIRVHDLETTLGRRIAGDARAPEHPVREHSSRFHVASGERTGRAETRRLPPVASSDIGGNGRGSLPAA